MNSGYVTLKDQKTFFFLSKIDHYYAGKDCLRGIQEFYEEFNSTRESGIIKKRKMLFFDEYPAFLTYLSGQDKLNKSKYTQEVLGIISELLMLGRGIQFGIIITCQRADSTWFSNGSRDNFMLCIALGRVSKEQKAMLFSGEDIPDEIFDRGEGLLLADGRELETIKHPLIENEAVWKEKILEAVNNL